MKCTLITGASGAVGTALVPVCLEDPTAEVKLVLRADSPQHLEQRMQELREFWRWTPADRHLLERVEAFRGDVRLPQWGLEPSDYRRLSSQATHVIHAAGNVRLNQHLDEARRTGVDSVRHAIQFVRDCQPHGRFQKLDLVSTVGVAGTTPGLIREQPYRPTGYHNSYEQAKSEGENLLLELIGQGFPATILRPSMVVGDSRDGRIIHFQVFYHLCDFLCGLRTRGVLPDTGNIRLDIVPADYVARAISLASQRQDAVGRILHLCSGPERSWNLAQYTERLREMLICRNRSVPPLQKLRAGEFRRWCAENVSRFPPAEQRFLQGLSYLLDYLDQEQLFDNAETLQYLAGAGLRPPCLEGFLPRVMDVYWSRAGSSPAVR